MTQPKTIVETSRKSHRLHFHRIDGPWGVLAGDVQGLTSGGGVSRDLSGEALCINIFNDADAWSKYGCIEIHYNALGKGKPIKIDLTCIKTCVHCGRDCYITVCVCEILEADSCGDHELHKELLEKLVGMRDTAITFCAVPTWQEREELERLE